MNKIVRINAIWCMSCIIMKQRLDDLQDEYQLEFIDLDYDEDDHHHYHVGDILPVNIILDENGHERKRLVGELSLKKLRKELNQ